MARHKVSHEGFEFDACVFGYDTDVYIERSFVGRGCSYDGFTVPNELILDLAEDIREEE